MANGDGRFLGFLNSSFGLWMCSAMLLPIAGYVYSKVQVTVDAERIAGETRKAQAIENARLIHEWTPELTSTDIKKARLAGTVLTHLAKSGSLDGELSAAVESIIDVAYRDGTQPGASVEEQAVANAIAKSLDPPPAAPAIAAQAAAKPGPLPAERALAVTLKPRVYIQIGDNAQREGMAGFSDTLRSQGFQAPGIELVPGQAPNRTEVRYYFADEGAQAGKVVELLKQAGYADATAKRLPDKYASRVRPGHFEVWIGKSALAAGT